MTLSSMVANAWSELSPGTYQFTQNACENTIGTVVWTAKSNQLLIPACPPGVGPKSTLKIVNQTGAPLTLSFVQQKGVNTYHFVISAGTARDVTMVQEYYQYTAVGCGGRTKTGKLPFSDSLKTWTWTCDAKK